ncbi:MAG: hypothetical protein JF606_03635 [Burkholderiales bacterium]|nr:hypothetical protein [Burkholderiales bacterium]
MKNAKRVTFASAATLATLLWIDPAIADVQVTSSPVPVGVATTSTISASTVSASTVSPSSDLSPLVAAPADIRRNPFGGKPMAASALAAKRGGESVFNDNQLKGVVANNNASNLTTGMNVISEGAFSGSSGLPTVIQNSGNNVLIQNATIVNVQLK